MSSSQYSDCCVRFPRAVSNRKFGDFILHMYAYRLMYYDFTMTKKTWQHCLWIGQWQSISFFLKKNLSKPLILLPIDKNFKIISHISFQRTLRIMFCTNLDVIHNSTEISVNHCITIVFMNLKILAQKLALKDN